VYIVPLKFIAYLNQLMLTPNGIFTD